MLPIYVCTFMINYLVGDPSDPGWSSVLEFHSLQRKPFIREAKELSAFTSAEPVEDTNDKLKRIPCNGNQSIMGKLSVHGGYKLKRNCWRCKQGIPDRLIASGIYQCSILTCGRGQDTPGQPRSLQSCPHSPMRRSPTSVPVTWYDLGQGPFCFNFFLPCPKIPIGECINAFYTGQTEHQSEEVIDCHSVLGVG